MAVPGAGARRPPPFPPDASISPRRGPLPVPSPPSPRAGWCAPLSPPCRHGGRATSPARPRAGREGAVPRHPARQSAARVARRLRQSLSGSVNHALSIGRSSDGGRGRERRDSNWPRGSVDKHRFFPPSPLVSPNQEAAAGGAAWRRTNGLLPRRRGAGGGAGGGCARSAGTWRRAGWGGAARGGLRRAAGAHSVAAALAAAFMS